MSGMTISLKEYFAASGTRFSAQDAAVIGPQLEALAEQGEDVTERTIVDVAQSANSPLHRFFEWDDKVAADKHRLTQAGTMMRAIRVKTLDAGRPRVMPAYRLARPEPKPVFRTGHNVLRGESAAAVAKAKQAMDELAGWRARYAPYVEVWADFAQAFRGVANQIAESEDAVAAAELVDRTDDALTELVARRADLIAWQEKHAGAVATWAGLAEQAAFLVQAIDEAEAVFTREKAVERSCLRCGTAFHSGGVGNRMCKRCGLTAEGPRVRRL